MKGPTKDYLTFGKTLGRRKTERLDLEIEVNKEVNLWDCCKRRPLRF